MKINPEQYFSYCKKFINAEADQSRNGLGYGTFFGQLEIKINQPAEKPADIKTFVAGLVKETKERQKKELDGLLDYWQVHPGEKLARKAFEMYRHVFYGEEKFFSEEERKTYFSKINSLSSGRALSSVPLSPPESSDR